MSPSWANSGLGLPMAAPPSPHRRFSMPIGNTRPPPGGDPPVSEPGGGLTLGEGCVPDGPPTCPRCPGPEVRCSRRSFISKDLVEPLLHVVSDAPNVLDLEVHPGRLPPRGPAPATGSPQTGLEAGWATPAPKRAQPTSLARPGQDGPRAPPREGQPTWEAYVPHPLGDPSMGRGDPMAGGPASAVALEHRCRRCHSPLPFVQSVPRRARSNASPSKGGWP